MSGPLRLQVPYLNKAFMHIHFHIWQVIISYFPEILFRCNAILLDSRCPNQNLPSKLLAIPSTWLLTLHQPKADGIEFHNLRAKPGMR